MAGVTLGFLKFVLGFDTIAFKKGMTAAERDLVVLQKKVEKFGKGMTDIGAKMSLAITAPLIAFAGKGIQEARETAKAMSEVNNALAQTGAVAGQTAPKLQAAADAFETKSLYEADQILSDVTSRLLTFGKILPSNFQAAQQASIDLAQKLGIDLSAAAVAVGKALQNPVTGMKALKAAGVDLTDAEKKRVAEMVKAGDAAKTQAYVLDLLASKTKNAAAAAQEADPWNKLQDAFNAMAEDVGTVLLPILTNFANWLSNLIEGFRALSPETQAWIKTIALTAAAIGPLLVILGTMVSTFAKLAPLVAGAVKLWKALELAFLAVRIALLPLGPTLAASLAPLAALAVAVGAVYLAWKYWPQITKFVSDVYTAVKTWLVDKLAKVWAEVKAKIDAVVGWFKGMYDAVVGHSYVPDMVDGIAATMQRLEAEMVEPVKKSTKAVAEAMKDLRDAGVALFRELYPEEARALQYKEDIKALKALKLSAEQTTDALIRLGQRRAEEEGISEGPPAWLGETEPLADFEPNFEEVIGKITDLTKDKTVEMAEHWEQLSVDAIGSMKDMVTAFKSGDILGGIQSLLDVVLQVVRALASVGVFGGTGGAAAGGASAGARSGFGGFRAMGGPVVPGKSYMVGENGPEFFSSKKRGYINPGREAAPTRVIVVPSPYFDTVVDHRAAAIAAPMAGQAAIIGVTGSETRMARRSRRNLLAA